MSAAENHRKAGLAGAGVSEILLEDYSGENLACLSLGSNIHPEANLPRAIAMLRRCLGVKAISTAWQTPAVGSHGPDFLNAAALVFTRLSPEELKTRVIRLIESQLGRVRTSDKNAPRPIDIDILVYQSEVIDPQLWNCAFLAVPAAELLPGLQSLETGETLLEIARRLSDGQPIHPRPEVLPGSLA